MRDEGVGGTDAWGERKSPGELSGVCSTGTCVGEPGEGVSGAVGRRETMRARFCARVRIIPI